MNMSTVIILLTFLLLSQSTDALACIRGNDTIKLNLNETTHESVRNLIKNLPSELVNKTGCRLRVSISVPRNGMEFRFTGSFTTISSPDYFDQSTQVVYEGNETYKSNIEMNYVCNSDYCDKVFFRTDLIWILYEVHLRVKAIAIELLPTDLDRAGKYQGRMCSLFVNRSFILSDTSRSMDLKVLCFFHIS